MAFDAHAQIAEMKFGNAIGPPVFKQLGHHLSHGFDRELALIMLEEELHCLRQRAALQRLRGLNELNHRHIQRDAYALQESGGALILVTRRAAEGQHRERTVAQCRSRGLGEFSGVVQLTQHLPVSLPARIMVDDREPRLPVTRRVDDFHERRFFPDLDG